MYGGDGDSEVLWIAHLDRATTRIGSRELTKAPCLQGIWIMSPSTTSLVSPPAIRANPRRFMLLSSPMVRIFDGSSEGSNRYFPLPQPRSRPTEPGASEEIKDETIGQGYVRVVISTLEH
jgi:hypothetical protein